MAYMKSTPGLKPAFSTALVMYSNGSALVLRLGAKPPSSPTPPPRPASCSTPLRVWYTSAHQRRPSAKLGAPTGMIINSWKSTLLSACTPPLRMFIMGVGSRWALTPPRYWYSDRPADSAAARATASDTPRMALAPSLVLLGVPSAAISAASTARWSKASRPTTALAHSLLTCSTA